MITTERMKRIRTLATLVAAAVAAMALGLLLISAKPSQAAPVSFSGSGQFFQVSGGEDSEWLLTNISGTSNGLPVGGSCRTRPGLSVFDARLATQGDAFDDGLTVFVDNQQYVSPDTVDLTGTTFTSGPVGISDLNTSVQYYISPTSATLRTFISLNNPTTNSITVPVTVASNFGSDDTTQIIDTSSGDTTFTTSDTFVITDDQFGDPTITSLVAAGSGSPQATPSAVSNTVFDCAGTQGVLVTYDVTIPAGQTRSVLLFNQLNSTATQATEDVGVFDDNTTLAATDFLAGLSQADLATVVNFDFGVDYAFEGFFSPVDNSPIVNSVKAGSAVPVKFSLGGDQGLDIFADGSPTSQQINCDSTDPVDPVEETVTAGSSSLSYDATSDRYTYVWKTNKAWAKTCRQLVVKLDDGTEHTAIFKFVK